MAALSVQYFNSGKNISIFSFFPEDTKYSLNLEFADTPPANAILDILCIFASSIV